MISQALSHFSMPWLSCIGLLLFFGIFVGAFIWVYRQGGQSFYERIERMPFEEENLS